MTRRTKILVSCLLILLCAGLLGYGALQHLASESPVSEPKDEAAKLAELEAALIRATPTSSPVGNETKAEERIRSSRASGTRST